MEIEENVRRFCSHSFDIMRYFVIEFLAEYFLVQDIWTSLKCITTILLMMAMSYRCSKEKSEKKKKIVLEY